VSALFVSLRDRAANAIYGTILVTAVIVALSEDRAASAGELIEAVATTTVVFWLAHSYADFLGERTLTGGPAARMGVRDALLRDVAMLEVAVLPLLALLLGVIHLVSRGHAVVAALAIGVAELFAWGYLAGRAPGASVRRSASIGLFNCGLGVLIVLLKALIH